MGANIPSCTTSTGCQNCACENAGKKPNEVCLWPENEAEHYPSVPTYASAYTEPESHAHMPACGLDAPFSDAVGSVEPPIHIMESSMEPPIDNLESEAAAEHEDTSNTSNFEFESAPSQPEVTQAQAVVKKFVRGLVKGRQVTLIAINGGTAECVVSLDKKLKTMSLQRAGKDDAKKRSVCLEDISEIAVGAESGKDFGLDTTDQCVTLMMQNGQAISMAFPDEEDRDTFALCMSMFVDGRRKEVLKKQAKAGLRPA